MIKDKQIAMLIKEEAKRQKNGLEMIPSENYVSSNVLAAMGSILTNKYSEGYPRKRYYGGNDHIDQIEILAQERAKKLFKVPHANVQPLSGSPANLAVYLATCSPGDVIMGQALTAGGHLTHGHSVSATGIFYKSVQYDVKHTVTEKEDLFDFVQIQRLARKHKPKLIWVGGTAHPLIFNYQKFAQIADSVGAYLAADIAHVAGLIAAHCHPSPVPFAHIVTTTTHKTLRGPRAGMIMVTNKGLAKDPDLALKVDRAIFPGLQGGPHNHTTAAIAVALAEASTPQFKQYGRQIVKNTKALARGLLNFGFRLVGSRGENHLILVNLLPQFGEGGGYFAQYALDRSGITVNKNTVPGEPSSPFYPSGIRLGTPALTTRGMKEKEMKIIAKLISRVLNVVSPYRLPKDKEQRKSYLAEFRQEMQSNSEIRKLRVEVVQLTRPFPIFGW